MYMPPGMHDLTAGDMPAAPTCKAASGLSGTILGGICVDMDNPNAATLLSTLGFTLAASASGCSGWALSGGQLQPSNINTVGNLNCAFSLPNIVVEAATYQSVMLVLSHQVTLSNGENAQVSLLGMGPTLVNMAYTTSSTVSQRMLLDVATSMLPAGKDYQPNIAVSAMAGTVITNPSWTIDSIAVLGVTNP
jgi:hypothetical protein